jgi:hypothetical protein
MGVTPPYRVIGKGVYPLEIKGQVSNPGDTGFIPFMLYI